VAARLSEQFLKGGRKGRDLFPAFFHAPFEKAKSGTIQAPGLLKTVAFFGYRFPGRPVS
jgi:hypothetical protein